MWSRNDRRYALELGSMYGGQAVQVFLRRIIRCTDEAAKLQDLIPGMKSTLAVYSLRKLKSNLTLLMSLMKYVDTHIGKRASIIHHEAS